jgi:trehalose 6-phosphate phosphatase
MDHPRSPDITTPHLFTPEGEAMLAATVARKPLLAFDFDGTLAPIVAQPDAARVPDEVALRLQALALLLPVAIVTGRSVADVRGRLGFTPHYIVGNHGAEQDLAADDLAAVDPLPVSQAMDSLRARLRQRQAELTRLGVTVEDKQHSMALHYRLSPQRELAQALIQDLLAPPEAALRIFAGKMVVNISPADSADKADAVQALVARCGASCAIFAGDDVNDEPVFVAAPSTWLTLRVGRDERHSDARYFVHGPHEMALLLDRILALLPAIEARGSA